MVTSQSRLKLGRELSQTVIHFLGRDFNPLAKLLLLRTTPLNIETAVQFPSTEQSIHFLIPVCSGSAGWNADGRFSAAESRVTVSPRTTGIATAANTEWHRHR